MVVLKFTTSESSTRNRDLTYTLPNLNSINAVSVNTGSVSVTNIEGDRVTVRVSGGSSIRSVITGWSSNPDLTKYVENQSSANYSDASGYSGTLTRYLHSGGIVPAESKPMSASRTSGTNSFPSTIAYNSGGFSGTLSKSGGSSVISGTPAITDSKEAATTQGVTVYSTWVWSYNSGWRLTGTDYNRYISHTTSDGYSGTLFASQGVYAGAEPHGVGGVDGATATTSYNTQTNFRGTVTKTIKPDDRVWQQSYSGTVTKPETNEEVYRYRGTVRKSQPDSPIYTYYYQYIITFDYVDFVAPPVNVDGVWREVKEVFANVDGTWRKVTNIYGNVDDIWKHHVK